MAGGDEVALCLTSALSPDVVFYLIRFLELPESASVACSCATFAQAHRSRLKEERTLDLSGSHLTDAHLGLLLDLTGSRCETLVADDCELSAVAFNMLAVHPRSLASLTRISIRHTLVEPRAFFALWSLPRLTALDVSDCNMIDEHGLCSNAVPPGALLAELCMARCARVTGEHSVTMLIHLLRRSVTAMDISGYDRLPPAAVSQLASRSDGRLVSLAVAEAELVNDAAVMCLAHCCRALQKVELSYCCEGITADSISALMMNCPSLCSLGLHSCSAIFIEDLRFPSSTTLSRLNLNRTSTRGTDPAALSALCRSQYLTHLDLGWLTEAVTDELVCALLTSLPLISHLNLEGCKMLTICTLQHVKQLLEGDLPSSMLQRLQLTTISPRASVQRAASSLQHLQLLDLSYVDCAIRDPIHDVLRSVPTLARRAELIIVDYYRNLCSSRDIRIPRYPYASARDSGEDEL